MATSEKRLWQGEGANSHAEQEAFIVWFQCNMAPDIHRFIPVFLRFHIDSKALLPDIDEGVLEMMGITSTIFKEEILATIDKYLRTVCRRPPPPKHWVAGEWTFI